MIEGLIITIVVSWLFLGTVYYIKLSCEDKLSEYNNIGRVIITFIGSPVIWIGIIAVAVAKAGQLFIDVLSLRVRRRAA